MTNEATDIANEVRAMNMPVSLQTIQNLTTDILNTNVSQQMVNQHIRTRPQEGLKKAKEVEELSQKAIKRGTRDAQSGAGYRDSYKFIRARQTRSAVSSTTN
ncbi:hypothetical protein OS493_039503 [Desmophyllum pertusum]|uniref:Uncharacterized protein n=1 Tax=Desmophyllum pertusum TaxID=174260 RepID=A0A9X0CZX4_9CNID|nr:hypothetical protein OS493_039503 [Desmophyllum pertusum]